MTERNSALERMQELYDNTEIGKTYLFTDQVFFDRFVTKKYIVLDKTKHNDYTYSYFCQCPDSRRVIYKWVLSKWSLSVKDSVIDIKEVL